MRESCRHARGALFHAIGRGGAEERVQRRGREGVALGHGGTMPGRDTARGDDARNTQFAAAFRARGWEL